MMILCFHLVIIFSFEIFRYVFLRNKIKQIYNGRIDLKTKFVAFRKYAFKWEGEEKMSHDLIFLKIK